MKIREIKELLNADVLFGEDILEREVNSACGCDMMSDVLAFVKDQSVLITGLCNPQVIRTAMMMDMRCVVFVRGKVPSDAIVELARDADIAVLITDMRMYTACGVLYSEGLHGGECKND